MTRIAKTQVHAALDRAARNILDARGGDASVSRTEMRHKLKELTGTEKALTDVFFRFVDHRDHVDGARITSTDVKKAVTYAREHLIDKYDLDRNGLSKDEISRMSLTGKLAVDLAKQLKAAAADGGTPASAGQQARELAKLADGLTYMSESDEPYKAFSVALEKNKALSAANLAAAAHLPARITLSEQDLGEFWASAKDPQVSGDDDVPKYAALEQAFGKLRDVKLFVDSNEDNIRSRVYLVGRGEDGSVVGLQSWRVWT